MGHTHRAARRAPATMDHTTALYAAGDGAATPAPSLADRLRGDAIAAGIANTGARLAELRARTPKETRTKRRGAPVNGFGVPAVQTTSRALFSVPNDPAGRALVADVRRALAAHYGLAVRGRGTRPRFAASVPLADAAYLTVYLGERETTAFGDRRLETVERPSVHADRAVRLDAANAARRTAEDRVARMERDAWQLRIALDNAADEAARLRAESEETDRRAVERNAEARAELARWQYETEDEARRASTRAAEIETLRAEIARRDVQTGDWLDAERARARRAEERADRAEAALTALAAYVAGPPAK